MGKKGAEAFMADLYLSPSRQDFNIYYDGSGSEK